jgi:hypothetical protein
MQLANCIAKGYSNTTYANYPLEKAMSNIREKYMVEGVDLYHVRNRNEQRVSQCLRKEIERLGLTNLPPNVIEDAFALALNRLPPRYTQRGTIVLRDPVKKLAIEELVTHSLKHVLDHPK